MLNFNSVFQIITKRLLPLMKKIPALSKFDSKNSVKSVKNKEILIPMIGVNKITNHLDKIIHEIHAKHTYQVERAILLTGPPGTGKSMVARIILEKYPDIRLFYRSGSSFIGGLIGDGPKNVSSLFEVARVHEGLVVIFIDEIEVLCMTRNVKSDLEVRQTTNQLLVELDGINSNHNIIFIGTTNSPIELLDPALLRCGRMNTIIELSVPSLAERVSFVQVYFQVYGIDTKLSTLNIGLLTYKMTGAELYSWAELIHRIWDANHETITYNSLPSSILINQPCLYTLCLSSASVIYGEATLLNQLYNDKKLDWEYSNLYTEQKNISSKIDVILYFLPNLILEVSGYSIVYKCDSKVLHFIDQLVQSKKHYCANTLLLQLKLEARAFVIANKNYIFHLAANLYSQAFN